MALRGTARAETIGPSRLTTSLSRASHLRDAGAVMIGEVLAAELELECSAGAPRVAGTRLTPRLLGECGAWLDIYAASIGGEVELALVRGSDGLEEPAELHRLVARGASAEHFAH